MIDPEVLARVEKLPVVERIAWAVRVANDVGLHLSDSLYGPSLIVRATRPEHLPTIEVLRKNESMLIDNVRIAARHANYALDQVSQ